MEGGGSNDEDSWKFVNVVDGEYKTDLDKVKEMVRGVMEVILSLDKMEGIKKKLWIMFEEALRVINKDEDNSTKMHGSKNVAEEQRLVGDDEQSRAFLEEKLILSMMHNDQGMLSSLIGSFEPDLIFEASRQKGPEVGLREKCVEEAN